MTVKKNGMHYQSVLNNQYEIKFSIFIKLKDVQFAINKEIDERF